MLISNFEKLKMLIELAKEIGLDESAWFEKCVERLSYRWNDNLYQRLLSYCLNNNLKPLLDTTFPIPVRKDDLAGVSGPYVIGTIADTNIDYGLHPLQLVMHSVIGGQSGFGKSTLVKVLAQPIMAEGKTKIWFIDPKEGGDYRSIAKQFQDMLILRPDVMRLNPFGMIENVPVEVLRESASECMADSFGVYDASESVITEHVRRIFSENDQPNFYDLVRSVYGEKVRYGGRRAGYLDTIKSRLTKIDASMGNIVNCKSDTFSEFYDRDVAFEIGSLSGNAHRILVPWIILKLVLYKIRNPTPDLSHLLVFDEAQSQIFSRQLEMRGRTSFMATLATQARAFGLGIIVLAQNPGTKLMTEIVANSCLKICFHLGSGDEVYAMSKNMGLDRDQSEALFRLGRGEAICRSALGYTEPVRLNVFNFQDQYVSDLELNSMMKSKWEALLEGIEPAKADKQLQLPVKAADSKSEKDSGKSQASVSGKTRLASGLSGNEEIYLRTVRTRPYYLVSEIYRIVGDEKIMGSEKMSQATAVKFRKALLKKGYLESFNVTNTGRSGRAQCDVVTDKAGVGKVKHPRGNHLHSFWITRVSEGYLRKGAKAEIGQTVSGHEVDCGVEIEDKKLGIEVVITGLVVENLPKNLEYYDKMLILCVDNAMKKKITKQIAGLDEEIRKRVTIDLLKKYFIPL